MPRPPRGSSVEIITKYVDVIKQTTEQEIEEHKWVVSQAVAQQDQLCDELMRHLKLSTKSGEIDVTYIQYDVFDTVRCAQRYGNRAKISKYVCNDYEYGDDTFSLRCEIMIS